MTADDDYKLLQNGIGFTNMVERATKGSADLTRKEIKEGLFTFYITSNFFLMLHILILPLFSLLFYLIFMIIIYGVNNF